MESHNVLDRISLAGRTKCTKVIHLGRVLSWFHGKMSPFSKNAIWGSPTNTHTHKNPSPKQKFFGPTFHPPFFRSGRSAKPWGSSQLAFVFFLLYTSERVENSGGLEVEVCDYQRWFACVTKTSEFSGRWWRNAEVSRDGKKICKS